MLSHLLKIYYKNSFTLKKLFGFDLKKNKGKTILVSVALIYGFGVILALFGWMFFDLGKALNDINQVNILLSFLGVFLIALPALLTIFYASGSLFYYKDYDIVGHLPIRSRTIFLAKLIVMISVLYTITFLAGLPIAFSYFYWQGFDLLSLLLMIIAGLVVPLIPIAVFSFLSLLIALVTSKMRFGKLMSILLLFILLLAFMFAMMQVNQVDVNPLTGQIDLFKGISDIYPPLLWYQKAIGDHDWLSLIYLLGSHGLLFTGFIIGGSHLSVITNKRGIRSISRHHGGELKLQKANIIQNLVKKEIKQLFSSVLYAMNTLFGLVLIMVLSVASLFYGPEINQFLQAEMGGMVTGDLVIVILMAFSVIMTMTPAVSLSLEGKKLWILKSLPIPAHKTMFAKILMNIVITIPVVVIGTILFGFSSNISIWNQVSMIVLFVSLNVLTSMMYSIINMLVPKFDFTSDTEVVKQSLSVILAILIGFSILVIDGLLYAFVFIDFNTVSQWLLLSLLHVVLIVPCWYVIRYQSEHYFNKYQA